MLVTCMELQGQEHEFRLYLGANYYQGDLSPHPGRFSLSPGNLAWGVMAGTKLSGLFRLNLKFVTGKISGSDSDAKLPSKRIRNLSFQSPLFEIGLNTEVNINHFLKGLDKFGIQFYYTTGVNLFKINPKAIYRNSSGTLELIELQPLGTEGQGLPGYDERYALTQINIPFGMGLKFQLFDNIEMGFEFVPRYTFTDYLDDVSGTYVNYDELLDAGRQTTAILANRMGEYLGSEPVRLPTGTSRGEPENNDWYFFGALYFSYNFGNGFTPKNLIKKKQLEESDLPFEIKN